MSKTHKYLVEVHDRHIDDEHYTFATFSEAFAFAQEQAMEIVAHPEHMKRRRLPGYSAYWEYELEEDHVWVKKLSSSNR